MTEQPPGDLRIHNRNRYSHGCRCRVCRAAHAARMRERRAAAFLPTTTPAPGVTHGTRYAYEECGCRCQQCVTNEASSSRYPEKSKAS